MRMMAWLGCGRALLIALFAGAAAAQSGGAWTFTDGRDGKKYKVVTIGSQMWTAENLNYQPPSGNSWCYDGENSNCGKYGRLYDWKTAREVCFPGWHLPSRQEWDELQAAVGGAAVAGKKLKARLGWSNNGNGTNEYLFSAMPAGRRDFDGSYEEAGKGAYWWTSTAYGVINAYTRRMRHGHDYVYENVDVKRVARSVRCVAD